MQWNSYTILLWERTLEITNKKAKKFKRREILRNGLQDWNRENEVDSIQYEPLKLPSLLPRLNVFEYIWKYEKLEYFLFKKPFELDDWKIISNNGRELFIDNNALVLAMVPELD